MVHEKNETQHSPDDFIRKSRAHEHVGLSRRGFHTRLQECRDKKLPLPLLRKHKTKDNIVGYRYADLMRWWYENETEIIEGEAS